MSKRAVILIHVAIWSIIFLSPLTFLNQDHNVNYLHYLMLCVSPLCVMIVFYANYLWLTPQYFITEKRQYYWLVNTIIIIILGTALHYWMVYSNRLFDVGHHHHKDPNSIAVLILIFRHVFNLAVSAAIATSIFLALRWQHSEKARSEAEAARSEAELRNLRNQINPHFLLNTLNNIYALTAFDTERAQHAIEQLSKMLRHMLYNQGELVKIEDEIQFLENYVYLMKIRLADNVDVRFTADIQRPDKPIAPMIFISLIENAFKHGVSPTQPSFIHISITADKERICCDIQNSNFPKSEQDRSGHGIGLVQVQKRLELSYPGRYEWTKGVNEENTSYTSKIIIYDT